MNDKNVGVIEGPHRLGFEFEAAQPVGVGRKGIRKKFESDDPVEAGVASAVNLAHTSGAEWRKHLVRSEKAAGGERD